MSCENNKDCLVAWTEGVRQYLQRTRYVTLADDIAQDFVLELLVNESKGQDIPSWPGTLPEDGCKRAIQMAKRVDDVVIDRPGRPRRGAPRRIRKAEQLTDVVIHPFDETVQRLGTTALKNLKEIESAFTKRQLKQMLEQSYQGVVTQKTLAESADLPYRTFKYKVCKLRSRH